uniref:ribonuclease H n=1 Tax=Salarias fasciatus TaxID=181472 RepID=A0A672H6H9_SALFA
MVHDLRLINKVTSSPLSAVPNPIAALGQVSKSHTKFSVIDLSNAFFCIPLAEHLKPIFAFTFRGNTYQYTRLPQGFLLSPGIFNQILKTLLEPLVLPEGVVLVQYVDDLLIAAPNDSLCLQTTKLVLEHLAQLGFKVSRSKLQCSRSSVSFLGRLITAEGSLPSAPHMQSILSHTRPVTVKDMLSFLGLLGFSRQFIPLRFCNRVLSPCFKLANGSYNMSQAGYNATCVSLYQGPDFLGTLAQSDFYWLCGHTVFVNLPVNWEGRCALVTLSENSYIVTLSLFPWLGVGKVMLRMETMDYRMSLYVNSTASAVSGLTEEVNALRLMELQDRMVLDLITAPQGGVCAIVGDSCCTFIPDNAGDEGMVTQAVQNLTALATAWSTDFRHNDPAWDLFSWFTSGAWWQILMKCLMPVVATLLIFCVFMGCILPCLRSMVVRMISGQVKYTMLQKAGPSTDDPE